MMSLEVQRYTYIYYKVKFEKGEFVLDNYGYLLNFDQRNKLKINWEISKRFKYGS